MTQDVLDQARAKMREAGMVDGGDARSAGVGVMTDARWKDFFAMASSHGVYPPSMDYHSAYSLQFLPARPAK
jgi:NitT/TauT family transport system substrate-binding protein